MPNNKTIIIIGILLSISIIIAGSAIENGLGKLGDDIRSSALQIPH